VILTSTEREEQQEGENKRIEQECERRSKRRQVQRHVYLTTVSTAEIA
jgi:hypothetical protein